MSSLDFPSDVTREARDQAFWTPGCGEPAIVMSRAKRVTTRFGRLVAAGPQLCSYARSA